MPICSWWSHQCLPAPCSAQELPEGQDGCVGNATHGLFVWRTQTKAGSMIRIKLLMMLALLELWMLSIGSSPHLPKLLSCFQLLATISMNEADCWWLEIFATQSSFINSCHRQWSGTEEVPKIYTIHRK